MKIKEKILKDKDLEEIGIMEKIEDKLYPIKPPQVFSKIRRAIVLGFNAGQKHQNILTLAEVSKVIGEGCGERFKHKSADRMPCNSFHLCPSCKIIKQKLGIK